MVTYRETQVDIGFIEPNSESNIVEWYYDGDIADIQHVQPNCGCTGDDVILGDRIQVQFNEEDTRAFDLKHAEKVFPSKIYRLTKSVDVYYNDGDMLMTYNDEGQKIFNPKKYRDKLIFTGKVRLDYLWDNK